MKAKFSLFIAISLSACLVALLGCGHPVSSETRTRLHRTNIVGIVGEASAEPYIEIQYSKADQNVFGVNKTEKITVSPPYVFQNNQVYLKYKYSTVDDEYDETLIHDYAEGGAEYFRIINHSPDKAVEVFFAGTQRMRPDLADWPKGWEDALSAVRYKGTPVYYLLYPERANGGKWGEIPLTKAWTIEEVAALYRAEYAYDASTKLTLDFNFNEYRMSDWIKKLERDGGHKGAFFYCRIQPGEQLIGSGKTWLLATPFMFNECMVSQGKQ